MAEQGIVLPWKVKGKGRIVQWVIYVIVILLLIIFLGYEYQDTPYLNIVLMVLVIIIIGYPLKSILWKRMHKERKRIDTEEMKEDKEEEA